MMKIMYKIIMPMIIIFSISGCGGSGKSNETKVHYGTIKYSDGSIFGFTKKESPIDGHFNIYDDNVRNVIGWIDINGYVMDLINNINLGVVSGLSITDQGVSGIGSVPAMPYTPPTVGGECTQEEYNNWNFIREMAMRTCLVFEDINSCNAQYSIENYHPCVHVSY